MERNVLHNCEYQTNLRMKKCTYYQNIDIGVCRRTFSSIESQNGEHLLTSIFYQRGLSFIILNNMLYAVLYSLYFMFIL